MCFTYDSHSDIHQESLVKSRKPHQCIACYQMIDARSIRLYASGVCEGSWYRFSMCARCVFDTLRVVARELDEGCKYHEAWPSPDDLVEHIKDYTDLGQTMPDAVPDWFCQGLELARQAKALAKFQQESIERLRAKEHANA